MQGRESPNIHTPAWDRQGKLFTWKLKQFFFFFLISLTACFLPAATSSGIGFYFLYLSLFGKLELDLTINFILQLIHPNHVENGS